MDLNKSVNLEALRSQINGETTKNFWMRGYAVFHEVFDSETVKVLKDEMKHYTEQYELKKEDIQVFQTKVGKRRDAFLNSAWEMKPFFEDKAIDQEGNLIVPKS